jgi:hypothetical protein
MMSGGLTRRTFLGAGTATLAAISLAPAATFAGGDPISTFALDATGGGDGCTTNCASCSACQHHLANKLFRTADAAESGRAHTGCRCTVVDGQSLSPAVFTKVFEEGDVADRRHRRTAALLGAATEQHSVPMFSGLVPMTVLAGGAAGIVWISKRRHQITPG